MPTKEGKCAQGTQTYKNVIPWEHRILLSGNHGASSRRNGPCQSAPRNSAGDEIVGFETASISGKGTPGTKIKIKTSREELARAQENVKVAESFLKKIEDKYRVIAIDDSPCPPAESQTAPRTPMGNEVSAGKISSVYHTPAPTPRLNSQPHIIGAPITLRF